MPFDVVREGATVRLLCPRRSRAVGRILSITIAGWSLRLMMGCMRDPSALFDEMLGNSSLVQDSQRIGDGEYLI